MPSPVTLRLRSATRERVARLARRQRVSASDVMREAIEDWVGRHEAAASPFDAVADLIGVVHGGNPERSTDAGRQFTKLLKGRRRP